jgi:hypothetical protein
MKDLTNVKIAIDFDGTIVEHAYPAIGREILFAFSSLKHLQEQGALLILWTYRTGPQLEAALEFCKKNGVEFYAVNANYPEERPEDGMPRKINAEIYIDDKNAGGFPGWGEIMDMIDPWSEREEEAIKSSRGKRFNIFSKK